MPKIRLISKYGFNAYVIGIKDAEAAGQIVNNMRRIQEGSYGLEKVVVDVPDLLGRVQLIYVPKSVILDSIIDYSPGDNTVPREASKVAMFPFRDAPPTPAEVQQYQDK